MGVRGQDGVPFVHDRMSGDLNGMMFSHLNWLFVLMRCVPSVLCSYFYLPVIANLSTTGSASSGDPNPRLCPEPGGEGGEHGETEVGQYGQGH
jgi:hypothetical protein